MLSCLRLKREVRLPFTWSNKSLGRAAISERIDRCIANPYWRLLFLEARVFPLAENVFRSLPNSDHCLILLDIIGVGNSVPKCFCFEEFWLMDGSCAEIISKSWRAKICGNPAF